MCFVLLVYNCGLTVRNKRICYVIFRRLDPSRKFAKVAHAATDIYRRTPDRHPAPHMRAVPITDVNYMPTLDNHYSRTSRPDGCGDGDINSFDNRTDN